MEPHTPQHDVALSFLASDERIASALHDLLSAGLKIFFYPRNQEDLAGTDGLETMRRPFLDDCRVCVVLYRERWGQTPWTRVEETAIKDGCLKHGWNRLFFIALDDTNNFPIWLPNTHIRFGFSNFGIEQAAGAIKARVQECGGRIAPATAMSRAATIQREAEHRSEKEELFRSVRYIQETVWPTINSLFASVVDLSRDIQAKTGIPLRAGADSRRHVSITDGRVGVTAGWRQPYSNVMGQLLIVEFERGIIVPGDNQRYISSPPEPINTLTLETDLSLNGELCWVVEGKPLEQLSSHDVAEKTVGTYLDLVQRANRGEIDFNSDLF